MKFQVLLPIAAGFCLMIPIMASALVVEKICAQTRDIWLAGTDEDIYYRLHGDQGISDFKLMDDPTKNDFERGQYDCFPLGYTNYLGTKIVKVDLKLVYVGRFGPDWDVDYVKVFLNQNGTCFKFIFDTELSRGNDIATRNAVAC